MPEITRQPMSHQMSGLVADISVPKVKKETEIIRLTRRPKRSAMRLSRKEPMM